MTRSRRVGLVSIVLGASTVVLTVFALILVPLNGGDLASSDTTGSAILALSFGVAGVLIVTRRHSNVIGWIMVVSGLSNSFNALTAEYPRYALAVHPDAPLLLGGLLAWIAAWVWVVGAAGFPLIVWLFPTGKPPSPGWSWLRWPILIAVGLVVLPMAWGAWEVRESAVLSGLRPDQAVGGLPGMLAGVGTRLLLLTLAIALVSAVARYRKAGLDERQQLKWLAWAGALTLVVLMTASPGAPWEPEGPLGEVLSSLAVFALPSIPAAITVAILRYRLYEIDRLVSRTLSYAVIAFVLSAVFLAGVVGIQAVLPEAGDLAVAGSTLAVAALFNPMRKRVQGGVDRRFNRSRYDAQRVLDQLAASMRDEIDPESVEEQWVGAVVGTMQPGAVAVWVRGAE